MVDTNITVQSPNVDAPVSVNFGGLFDGVKASMDDIVADIKSGSATALTGLFLSGMLIVAGIYIWRRV